MAARLVTAGAVVLAMIVPVSLAVPAQASAGRGPAAPALARTSISQTARGGAAAGLIPRGIRVGVQYAAGYEVRPGAPSPVSSISGEFVVPGVSKCAARELLDPLIQVTATIHGPATAEGAGAYVLEQCAGSSVSYTGVTYTETGGRPISKDVPFTVSPGNLVEGMAGVTSSGALTATLQDVTTGKTFTQSGSTTAGGHYTAAAVMNTDTIPIPTFGFLQWSSVKVNHKPIAADKPGALVIKNAKTGDLLINTGPLSSTGTSFINAFVASQ